MARNVAPRRQADEDYPGWTVNSDSLGFPTDRGARAAAQWVDLWLKARRTAEEPGVEQAEEPTPLDIPPSDLDEIRGRYEPDAGWEFQVWRETDGRYTWRVIKGETILKSDTSDTWDDAKLESIIDFPPPSGEA